METLVKKKPIRQRSDHYMTIKVPSAPVGVDWRMIKTAKQSGMKDFYGSRFRPFHYEDVA